VITALRPPGLRPDGAADFESELERRLDGRPQTKSQYPVYLRRQLQVERICRIPRLVAELLDEIARCHDLRDDIDGRLSAYADLDHDLLAALGADSFAQRPLRAIGGGR
jgi:hypothetical protein